jgi:predicted DNA-binding transcriptional regulator AlpA
MDAGSIVFRAQDAANYVGLSASTLAKMRVRGVPPPFVKLGRRIVYRRSDLDDWLASNMTRSTSEPQLASLGLNNGR